MDPEAVPFHLLIAPDVFLTAGHCMFFTVLLPTWPVYVSFDQVVNPADPGGEGTEWISAKDVMVHPGYYHDQGNDYDLAVIILEDPIDLPLPVLPSVGLLDELTAQGPKRGTDFTLVGYGAQTEKEHGPVRFWLDGWRNYASAPLQALTPTLIVFNINEDATGAGGACSGDSGVPALLPMADGTILAGVSSLRGDRQCRAMTTYYRLDTPWAREFLGQFVPLP